MDSEEEVPLKMHYLINLVIIGNYLRKVFRRLHVSDRRQEFPVFTSSDQPCVLAWRCCPVTATAGSSWRQRRGGLALRPAAEPQSSRSAPAQTAARRGTAATLVRRRGSSEQSCRWYLALFVILYRTVKS